MLLVTAVKSDSLDSVAINWFSGQRKIGFQGKMVRAGCYGKGRGKNSDWKNSI